MRLHTVRNRKSSPGGIVRLESAIRLCSQSSDFLESRVDAVIRRPNPGAFLGTTKETKTPLFGTFWAAEKWLKVASGSLKVA